MTALIFGRDANGFNSFSPAPANTIYNATLSANTAKSITIPSTSNNWIVAFSTQSGTDIWVDFTGAIAIVPSGSVFTLSSVEQNPGSRVVKGGSSISIITPNTSANVCIVLYSGS